MKKKVAMIQMDVTYGDPKVNFNRVGKWVMDAVQVGAEIIVLPELWDTGYDLDRFDVLADKDAKATIEFLGDLARELNVAIVGGSAAEQDGEDMKNTMLVVDEEGNLVHKYSKLHLFQLMDEHLHLTSGEDYPDFKLAGIDSAGFICYDIRFPEWMRKSAVNGAKVMYVVAQWPKQRIDHWCTLLQARAIENQCYIVACNRVGADPDNEFGGMSMVVDPWGNIVTEGGDDEKIVLADIELDKVDDIRSQISIFQDRKAEWY
ncbi:carbon-nitrogen family hydrolase [Lentibacillus cibarius]|uniref:Carbon-nitrogen family hydrolase n=1 Tax=Lentibacillus cibarius TaxID=2583219 RepID=A0A549YEG5_9BACI|nr:carbon-nitrogen family hydrolase [Lentibacillus cibarius]TMN21383.1 carbon-nitrogen family hydrolase [Lentibacillus cibarius]TRM10262.1 carbon-nitrogen family hydrolase [Lentibacillus cibarius]